MGLALDLCAIRLCDNGREYESSYHGRRHMGDEFEFVGYGENPDRGRSVRDRLGRGEERASEEQPTRTDHWWVWDLEDVCDDDRELESLRALMWRFTVKELKEGSMCTG
jgi:hypothetical protein